MKYALISVSDKTGIIDFAKRIVENGYEIISTGGTRKLLEEGGIKTIKIDDFTGFPEMFDGRVKTLHPKIHGGLLHVRDNEKHLSDANKNKILPIDLVVVNLYPFKEVTSKEDVTYDEAVENIDIGGPSMLRSAAKNHKFVTVVCDKDDYDLVASESPNISYETNKRLAAKAFRHTASYDSVISNYFSEGVNESLTLTYDLVAELRYGENPHQKASFYKGKEVPYSIASSKQLHGKQLSYNNIQDANAALQIISEYDEPCFVALKHMNPCGIGIAGNTMDAWQKAYKADPVSIFGGIVVSNREITLDIAKEMNKIFLEIVIAPSYSEEAIKEFSKKKNLRVLIADMSKTINESQYHSVTGGLLVQDYDSLDHAEFEIVTDKTPNEEEINDLKFAWKAVKHVKSNAILLASNGMTVGIGAGQMNRVGAAKIALEWAKEHGHNNMVLASDAFFPFDDVVRLASEYGVTAIIQPGGSIRDANSIKACNELGISMIFTKTRHFKH